MAPIISAIGVALIWASNVRLRLLMCLAKSGKARFISSAKNLKETSPMMMLNIPATIRLIRETFIVNSFLVVSYKRISRFMRANYFTTVKFA